MLLFDICIFKAVRLYIDTSMLILTCCMLFYKFTKTLFGKCSVDVVLLLPPETGGF